MEVNGESVDPAILTRGEILLDPLSRRLDGSQRPVLDVFEKKLVSCQNSNPGSYSQQSSLYIDCGVQAKIVHVIQLNILLIIQSASIMVMY
jgi:hypothetical protein